MDSMSVPAKFIEVRSFTRSWDNSVGVFGGVVTPVLGKRRQWGIWDGTIQKSIGEFL